MALNGANFRISAGEFGAQTGTIVMNTFGGANFEVALLLLVHGQALLNVYLEFKRICWRRALTGAI